MEALLPVKTSQSRRVVICNFTKKQNMNKKILTLIFSTIFTLNNFAQSPSIQKVNLSSVDYFFTIKDKISLGKSITEDDWKTLFNTNGYKISATSSMRKKIIKEMMIAAYNPNFKLKKDSILNISIEENLKNPYALLCNMTLSNFIDYSKNEKNLKRFRSEYDFKAIPEYSKIKLKNFLINPVDSLIKVPTINFLCYEPDAQSKEKGIVVDFNLFYKQNPSERIDFIAHETFHKYRRNFINTKLIESNAVLREIDKLQDEGIADLIDKKENLLESINNKGLPEIFVKQYYEAFQNTSDILKEFDNIVNSFLSKEISQEQMESKVNNFFLSGGHPNGYFMARLIEKAGLKNEMINNFYSPTEFIKTYNEAAKKENGYIFSDEFIHYIESLK
ncbi:DUF5700 domain-containing putative Zn-dependent protease [Cloacibacterium sp.]|uniref:DUF5700 domain-containing putative Zn-dependent protease n=1 Tax=Cloacibacterium sp. TaxID=1913682 RepID=UPI0039E62CB8